MFPVWVEAIRGSKVQNSGSGRCAKGLGLRVEGLGFRVQGLGFSDSGFRVTTIYKAYSIAQRDVARDRDLSDWTCDEDPKPQSSKP